MRTFPLRFLTLALTGLFAAGPLALAENKTYHVSGPVNAVDGNSVSLTQGKGKEGFVIRRTAGTQTAGSVKPGDVVEVEYFMTASTIAPKGTKTAAPAGEKIYHVSGPIFAIDANSISLTQGKGTEKYVISRGAGTQMTGNFKVGDVVRVGYFMTAVGIGPKTAATSGTAVVPAAPVRPRAVVPAVPTVTVPTPPTTAPVVVPRTQSAPITIPAATPGSVSAPVPAPATPAPASAPVTKAKKPKKAKATDAATAATPAPAGSADAPPAATPAKKARKAKKATDATAAAPAPAGSADATPAATPAKKARKSKKTTDSTAASVPPATNGAADAAPAATPAKKARKSKKAKTGDVVSETTTPAATPNAEPGSTPKPAKKPKKTPKQVAPKGIQPNEMMPVPTPPPAAK